MRLQWTRRFRIALAILGLVLLFPKVVLSQQACDGSAASANCTATVTLPPPNLLLVIQVSPTSTTIPAPTNTDFIAGFKEVDGPTITVKANTAYSVSTVGNTGLFLYSGAYPNPNKPSSDLHWGSATGTSCAGASYNHTMGATTLNLLQGTSGAPGMGVGPTTLAAAPSQKICYRMLWDPATSPTGTYTLVVNFTISSP